MSSNTVVEDGGSENLQTCLMSLYATPETSLQTYTGVPFMFFLTQQAPKLVQIVSIFKLNKRS